MLGGVRLRLAISILTALVLGAPFAQAQEGPPNPPPFDHVGGGNVVPPGNTGHIPLPSLPSALMGTYENANMTEQRDLYFDFGTKDWSLASPGGKPSGSDPRDELGEPYSPRDGVVIYRDGWGVPHIYGETDVDAQFGAGYAVAEDRLFQADIFRHVARGEMAQFVGGQSWYDYDRAWRAEFYTDDELLAMAEEFYTDEQLANLEAYRDGINAYIEEAMQDPNKLPGEYVALGQRPEPWEVVDSLSVAVLQARDSVEGFGQELFNADFLADVTERLGEKPAREVLADVRFYRDPGTYTTAPRDAGLFPYPGGGFDGLSAPAALVPDAGTAVEELRHEETLLKGLSQIGFGRRQASNAITVTGRLAKNGDPILLGGPQLDYLIPSIFYEFEINSPTQHARGVGFAGTAGIILIGKTPTHAWSITYGYTDQIDVFLVPIDPEDETRYLHDGESKEFESYTTTVLCKADHAGLASPSQADLCDGAPVNSTEVEVRRVPEYGPVIGEVTVDGKSFAVVKVRAHWMREVQNALPFLTMNQATTMNKFHKALEDFNVSLNVNYVDDRGNAGFWHVARPPIRADGTDVRLPTLGDGSFDWEGFLPLDRIPHAINPKQGYTVNWNNQIAKGWHNGDQNYWGDLQRVNMLARRMSALARKGKVTPADVWRVNREAAYEDGRWFDYMPLVRRAFAGWAPKDANVKQAVDVLKKWNGQRTASEDADGVWRYDYAAVGIFDEMVAQLQQAVMADEFGETYYELFGPELDVDFYHLKSTLLLKILKGRQAPLRATHDWLDGKSVTIAIREALEKAIAALAADFEGDPSGWKVPAVMTTYRAVGVGEVAPHPFMNRGTYNQLAIVNAR
ncbi:MAG TPA: penicillin acylase family protein [Actinomycetota bacterium]|nr:penicillin acylase family protein [Actinomycetota bacterium]